MKRFCTQCGTPANEQDRMCTECGARLAGSSGEVKSVPATPRKQVTKKQKWMYGTVGAVAAFLIGFSVWANGHFAEEAVQERFDQALADKDASKLSKLTIREDGEALTVKEAEAFLRLAKQEKKSVMKRLYEVVPAGKFLGLYPKHAVQVIDQYAEYDGETDGVTFRFDGMTAPVLKDKEGMVTFGPFSPGLYKVSAEFDSEFGKESAETELALSNKDSDAVWLDLDLDIGKVQFEIPYWNDFASYNPWIQIEDKKIFFLDDGTTKEIGPIILNGSQKAKVGLEMPWGQVFTEPYSIDNRYVEVNPVILNKKQIDEILTVLTAYGEESAQMLASHNADKLTSVSASLKEKQAASIKDYKKQGYYFTGSFEMTAIDINTATPTEDGVQLLTEFHYNMDFHELGEEAFLEDGFDTCLVELKYSSDNSKWIMNDCERGNYGYYEITNEMNGSRTVHSPSGDLVKAAKNKKLEQELEEFMYRFNERSVDAINARDFNIIEQYITEDGPRRKEAKDYIDYLDSKNITERLLSTELEKVEDLQNGSYNVTTIEKFEIYRPDATVTKKFRTVTLVKQAGGEFRVYQLISTKEI